MLSTALAHPTRPPVKNEELGWARGLTARSGDPGRRLLRADLSSVRSAAFGCLGLALSSCCCLADPAIQLGHQEQADFRSNKPASEFSLVPVKSERAVCCRQAGFARRLDRCVRRSLSSEL